MSNAQVTRVIPGLNAEHRIVSMPLWAWFWLDDFVTNCSPRGYKGVYEAFGDAICPNNLSETLCRLAQLHQDFCLREIYNLANDDEPDEDYIQSRVVEPIKQRQPKELNLPKIYKIFGFMPCATTLDAVWQRKHYIVKDEATE